MLNTDFTALLTFVTQSAKNYTMTMILIIVAYWMILSIIQTLTTNILSIIFASKCSTKDVDNLVSSK